jgi:hypothetical protein
LADNEAEIPRIAAMARRIGAFYRLDDQLSARLDGSLAPLRYRPSGIKKHLGGNEAGARGLCACGIASTQAAVTPQGRLKPCLMLERPCCGILKHGLGQAWARLRRGIARMSRQADESPVAAAFPCLAQWRLAKS